MAKMKPAASAHKFQWLKKYSAIYVVVFVLLISMVLVSYYQINSTVINQTNQYNGIVLAQLKAQIDNSMDKVTNLAYQLSVSKIVNQVSLFNMPLNSADRYKIIELIDSLKPIAFMTENRGIIDSIAVYFPYSNIVITPQAMYSDADFFASVYHSNDLTFDQWQSNIAQFYSGAIQPYGIVKNQIDDQGSYLCYIQSIEYAANDIPAANILVLLDKQRLQNLLRELETEVSGTYILLKGTGLAVSSGNFQFDGEAIAADSDAYFASLVGQGFKVTEAESSFLSLDYVIVSDTRKILRTARNVQLTSILGALALLAGIVIISLFLIYLFYRPLKQILNLLPSGGASEPVKKDIFYLKETISGMLDKERAYSQSLGSQWKNLKDAVLDKLTRGCFESVEITESMSQCDIHFPYDNFCVALLYFNELPRTSRKTIVERTDEQLQGGMSFSLDAATLVIILNLNEAVNPLPAGLVRQIRDLQDYWRQEESMAITACLGHIYPGYDGIRRSYEDATTGFGYRIILGRDVLITPDVLEGADTDYFYPFDVEISLIAAVKSGSYDEASAILNRLYEENFIKRKLPIKIAQCMFYDLMGTAIKSVDGLNLKDLNFDADADLVHGILQCQTAGEIFAAMKQYYLAVCQYIGSRKKSRKDELMAQIMAYIEKNYTDPNFSQSQMASELQITPNYLSTVFKNAFNENMIDTVNRLRARKAAELLRTSTMVLTDVAQHAGCATDATLTRIFKKYYHTTPGAYRMSAGTGTVQTRG